MVIFTCTSTPRAANLTNIFVLKIMTISIPKSQNVLLITFEALQCVSANLIFRKYTLEVVHLPCWLSHRVLEVLFTSENVPHLAGSNG